MVHMTFDEVDKIKREHLTVKEVSSALGISRHAFYKYSDSFPFPIIKIGRQYRIPKKPFVDFLTIGGSTDFLENDGENGVSGEERES